MRCLSLLRTRLCTFFPSSLGWFSSSFLHRAFAASATDILEFSARSFLVLLPPHILSASFSPLSPLRSRSSGSMLIVQVQSYSRLCYAFYSLQTTASSCLPPVGPGPPPSIDFVTSHPALPPPFVFCSRGNPCSRGCVLVAVSTRMSPCWDYPALALPKNVLGCVRVESGDAPLPQGPRHSLAKNWVLGCRRPPRATTIF